MVNDEKAARMAQSIIAAGQAGEDRPAGRMI